MVTAEEERLLDPYFAQCEPSEITIERMDQISAQAGVSLRKVEWFAISRNFIPHRYQKNLGIFFARGQLKLLESTAVMAGLGGLGGQLLEQLGRAGVGKIIAVEPDVFDETNLNRQLLSNESNLGTKKVDEAKKHLDRINRAVEFVGFHCRLEELPDDVWEKADLVFDCLDNIDDRLVLARKCSASNCPLVHGAVAGWYGEVGIVRPGSKMLEKHYQSQREGLENELGTPVFTAAVAASLMAAKGCQILMDKCQPKQSTMHFFDLLADDWENIQL